MRELWFSREVQLRHERMVERLLAFSNWPLFLFSGFQFLFYAYFVWCAYSFCLRAAAVSCIQCWGGEGELLSSYYKQRPSDGIRHSSLTKNRLSAMQAVPMATRLLRRLRSEWLNRMRRSMCILHTLCQILSSDSRNCSLAAIICRYRFFSLGCWRSWFSQLILSN